MRKPLYLLMTLIILSCEKENQNVIDINFSNPPIIRSIKIEPEAINLDTIIVGSEISPEDTLKIKIKTRAIVIDKDGQNDISKTICEIINPYRGVTLTRTDLARINDSTFYGEPEFKIKRKEAGIYQVKIFSIDKSNFSSNEIHFSLNLYRGNRPPVISDLVAPDSVLLQTQVVLIKITLKATDPDGNNDIKSVQFNSYRPDGSPSSGNPFRMYDDGNASGVSGDERAGDGIYSIIVQLPPNTQKGRYKFEFFAIDRAGALSNFITHFITVL
ncbi:MAG: hypothetical protein RMJ81_07000 [Candidatus Kryptonium sp.]|nr:hypothetical protein [Candidatus Kryptonium sp.]MDW8109381.1 hypothetical protein [Candidatus Kryptonium sp.]